MIRVAVATVAAAAIVIGADIAYRHWSDPAGGGVFPSRGIARIGGPFELTGEDGKTYRWSDFDGQYRIVYFGYAYCPDVCPTELQLITEALGVLGPTAKKVQPLMITMDPERDTVEVLADYVSNFHPSIMALTGSVEQIKAVAGAYKAYFAKGAIDKDGEYFMDHSPFIYLMGPKGQYLHHFAPNTSSEVIAARIQSAVSES